MERKVIDTVKFDSYPSKVTKVVELLRWRTSLAVEDDEE